jgi:hypothetical protein
MFQNNEDETNDVTVAELIRTHIVWNRNAHFYFSLQRITLHLYLDAYIAASKV